MGEASNYGNEQKTNNNFKDESELYSDGQSYRTHCGLCCKYYFIEYEDIN